MKVNTGRYKYESTNTCYTDVQSLGYQFDHLAKEYCVGNIRVDSIHYFRSTRKLAQSITLLDSEIIFRNFST